MELLAVGIGCAIGAVCRYLLEAGINNFAIDAVSILIINCLGCLLMGLFTGIIEKRQPSKNISKLLTTGFCGGLTTFSTFSGNIYQLLISSPWVAVLIAVAMLGIGMGMYAVGLRVTRGKRSAVI